MFLRRKLRLLYSSFIVSVLILSFTFAYSFDKEKTELQSKYILGSKTLKFSPQESYDYVPDSFADIEQKFLNKYVENLISTMTLEEKVGQMFMWKAQGTSMNQGFADFLKTYKPSGVILMDDNISPDIKKFTDDIQKQNSNIPFFISIDQEGGVVKRLKNDPNPGALALSQLSDDRLCNSTKETSQRLAEIGINLNFGIIGDIGWYPDSFIAGRTFGNTPQVVADKSSKAVQCTDKVLSTIKHFPGHGRTKLDSHRVIPEINITYDEWNNTDSLPFKSAITNNVDFVMTGHLKMLSIDDKPASLSAKDIQILRDMKFDGVVITDDMIMLDKGGVDPYVALDSAIDAGNDILLYAYTPVEPKLLYERTLNRAKNGEISKERIDASVARILKKKFKMTFFN